MARKPKSGSKPKSSTADSPKSQRTHPELRELLDVLLEYGVRDYETEGAGKKIRVSFGGAAEALTQVNVASIATKSVPASTPAVPARAANLKEFTSPLVGTFYRSPSPGADPYVREGQGIKAGEMICIIEAMKLMNEIEADFGGKIVSILAENGQPVAYGEPLFLIET